MSTDIQTRGELELITARKLTERVDEATGVKLPPTVSYLASLYFNKELLIERDILQKASIDNFIQDVRGQVLTGGTSYKFKDHDEYVKLFEEMVGDIWSPDTVYRPKCSESFIHESKDGKPYTVLLTVSPATSISSLSSDEGKSKNRTVVNINIEVTYDLNNVDGFNTTYTYNRDFDLREGVPTSYYDLVDNIISHFQL